MEIHADGYGICSCNCRDFFQRKSLAVKKPEHFKECRLELSRESPDRVLQFARRVVLRRGEELRDGLDGVRGPPPAQVCERSIFRDGIKPCCKSRPPIKRVQ